MITVTNTVDMSLVKEILLIDEIFEQAAEDGVLKENVTPTYDNRSCYLLCKNDDDVIGVIYVHHDNACSIVMHPYLKQQAKRLGRDVMHQFFRWFLSLPDLICKVNVTIPTSRRIVDNFAKRVGFVDEGIN